MLCLRATDTAMLMQVQIQMQTRMIPLGRPRNLLYPQGGSRRCAQDPSSVLYVQAKIETGVPLLPRRTWTSTLGNNTMPAGRAVMRTLEAQLQRGGKLASKMMNRRTTETCKTKKGKMMNYRKTVKWSTALFFLFPPHSLQNSKRSAPPVSDGVRPISNRRTGRLSRG